MSNDEWFVIKDFDSFVKQTRVLTYNSYGDKTDSESSDQVDLLMDLSINDQNELDQILTQEESAAVVKSIAIKQRNKKSKKIRYILNDSLYLDIIQSLGDRMTSNILQGLVKKGLVETGFDSESNDFIFWIKNEDQEEKPETD